MLTWILISILTMGLTGSDAKELAQKGYSTFKEVIAGDEAKMPEAIRYLEEARKADETNVPNLYNLARAYLVDAMTFNNSDSAVKSEKTFARIIELDPSRTDAMAFHGMILTQMSGGKDMAMFMRGAQELKTAAQRTPNDITVRIVLGFVGQNLPPEARPLIGANDSAGNFQFVGKVFDGLSSDFAPHADVVMNAFVGEALMASGDEGKARASFEKALKVPQPDDAGQRAGRQLLDSAITARMRGESKSLFSEPVFNSCHSCHLAAPDKLLSR